MDDGENELSNPPFFPNYIPLDDEIVKHTNKSCTHTHTCNPAGPNDAHTHTCYHTHTQVISSLKPKSSLGNREAVKKYREKKKAHTAFLEEEVKKLRLLNRSLVRKLQGQAALEAEISSLRALLVDLKGNIDDKLGCFPFQNHCSANSSLDFAEGKGIGLQCLVENTCFELSFGDNNNNGVDKPVFSWQENCEPVIDDCNATGNMMVGSLDRSLKAVESLGCVKKIGQ